MIDLANFVRWCIEAGPFDGCDLDGGSIQDEAVKAGILIETKYDPEQHEAGSDCGAEEGDPWYVFSPEFSKLLETK